MNPEQIEGMSENDKEMMGIKKEEAEFRPSNFDEVVGRFKKQGRLDEETLQDIVSMSKGVDHIGGLGDNDIRQKFYEGWTDDNFKELLDELGYTEEGEII